MSDYWQGPGWRRADDGKWYPEAEMPGQAGVESEAQVAPPPPPPPPPPATSFPPPPPTTSFPPPTYAPPTAMPPAAAPTAVPPPFPTSTPVAAVPVSSAWAPPTGPPAGGPPPPGYAPAAAPAAAPSGYPLSSGLPLPPPSFAPNAGPPAGPPAMAPGGAQPYGWPMIAPIQPVSSSLAGWLSGVFWAVAALSVLSTLAAVNARGSFETFAGGLLTRGGFDDWSNADSLVGLVALISLPLRLALLVLLIVWSWKCHKAAAGLNPGPRRWSSGWTIGGWFIPFASIVLPKLVIDESEKIARAPRIGGTAVEWKAVKVSRVGSAWWALFILSSFVAASGGFGDRVYNGPGDRSSISNYYVAIAIGGVIAAASAVCGALYTKDLSRLLSPAGFYGPQATSGVGTLTVAGDPNASVEAWAARTAHAAGFCGLCREPLAAGVDRCPRCGKRRPPA